MYVADCKSILSLTTQLKSNKNCIEAEVAKSIVALREYILFL